MREDAGAGPNPTGPSQGLPCEGEVHTSYLSRPETWSAGVRHQIFKEVVTSCGSANSGREQDGVAEEVVIIEQRDPTLRRRRVQNDEHSVPIYFSTSAIFL